MDNKFGNGRNAVCLVLGLALMAGCQLQNSDEAISENTVKPIAEVIEPVLESSYHVEREYVGFVRAKDQARLGFELSGQVEQILVEVGDHVQQGQPLIALDKRLLITEARQLKAQQSEVSAQLRLIETNLKRQLSLKNKGFSAEAEIDSLTSQKNVLLANRQQLVASIEANRLQQEKSQVLAPFSGIISQRLVSQGDVVTMGATTLTLLADESLEVHIGVPAQYAKRIVDQAQWQIRIDDQLFPAMLVNPGPQVNTQSRTVELRFTLPPTAKLLDGQLGYLQYHDQRQSSGYWLPLSALTDGLRGTWNVFVVDRDDQVQRAHVELIYANNDAAYIRAELSPDDRIVASGLHRIIPGQRVETLLVDSSNDSETVSMDGE
ncbi:efflux RND transporter periplasmic adaptor subunit [Vibrio sp. WXL210]|uniref:efflux RND transporter periplasmic adaptor subunit n=1 Tax=Vibrio sp. WXL210 TaxID=3450709 RepID=UPI003EC6AB0C